MNRSCLAFFVLVVAPLLWATACLSASGESSDSCRPAVQVTEAALFGATPRSDFLVLSALEENAVVALVYEEPVFGLCTGVLIAPTTVLTAKHCIRGPTDLPDIRVGSDLSAPEWAMRAEQVVLHPTLDLAMLHLPLPVPGDLAKAIMPVGSSVPFVGRRAQLAGYGQTEDGTFGIRLFTDEAVVDEAGALLSVDGDGERGACVGDSGGPLLIRDALERARVVGVLSQGSANCLHVDQYVLVSQAIDWLDANVDSVCVN